MSDTKYLIPLTAKELRELIVGLELGRRFCREEGSSSDFVEAGLRIDDLSEKIAKRADVLGVPLYRVKGEDVEE